MSQTPVFRSFSADEFGIVPADKRPVPHIEPQSSRERGKEAGRVSFIHNPVTKGGETGLEYAFGHEEGELP
jgi:hypothetical protein